MAWCTSGESVDNDIVVSHGMERVMGQKIEVLDRVVGAECGGRREHRLLASVSRSKAKTCTRPTRKCCRRELSSLTHYHYYHAI